jgi:hypothetical protein
MKSGIILDTEQVFQLVNKKDWQKLIEVFKDNNNNSFIINEPVLKPLIDKYFIDELLTNSSMKNDPAYKYYLQSFYMLHNHKKYTFQLNPANYKKLIAKIVDVEEDLDRAYEYATKFPDEPNCKKVIDEYQENLPKVVRHSQERELYVTENKNIHDVDASIGLFKSNLEYQFYRAVREVFQMHLVFPNVALNAVISFDLIKSTLTAEERKYFFGALLDCVVIDSENNYKPIKFIELDSPYHDTEAQIMKDKLKDNILAKSGLKLIRVRRSTFKEDEKDFIKLIRETIK